LHQSGTNSLSLPMNKVDSFAGSNIDSTPINNVDSYTGIIDFTSYDKRDIKKENSDFQIEHKFISFDSDKQIEYTP